MNGPARSVLFKSWTSLWQGAIGSHRAPMSLTSELADKTEQLCVGLLKQPESLSNLMLFSLVRALN